ncbi:MAG: nucleotidyltransferase family protein [Evtepia sp.]
MTIIGIIAEYNPFHLGHSYHIREIRRVYGKDTGIIAIMSGNFTQRGDAAIFNKWSRAHAALQGGVDLILELPTVFAVSSAAYFAQAGVSLLEATGLVDVLSFGSELGEIAPLSAVCDCLCSDAYESALRLKLADGLSFAKAREMAVFSCIGVGSDCMRKANNNLGIEYLCALKKMQSKIEPSTVLRLGEHDSMESSTFSSASYLRSQILSGNFDAVSEQIPDFDFLRTADTASLAYCTRGVFTKLRTISDWSSLPDCDQELAHRLSRAAGTSKNLDEFYALVKTRRYTHARIRRLVLWAFLGLTNRPETPLYLRVLGANERGKKMLHQMKTTATLPIVTKPAHMRRLDEDCRASFESEVQSTALYDLCRENFGTTAGINEYTSHPVFQW